MCELDCKAVAVQYCKFHQPTAYPNHPMNDLEKIIAAAVAAALEAKNQQGKRPAKNKLSLDEMQKAWSVAREASLEKQLRLMHEREILLRERMEERATRAEEKRLRLKAEREAEREANKAKRELSREQEALFKAAEKDRLREWKHAQKELVEQLTRNGKFYDGTPLAIYYNALVGITKSLKVGEGPPPTPHTVWSVLDASVKRKLHDYYVANEGSGMDLFMTAWWDDPENDNPPDEETRRHLTATLIDFYKKK